MRDKPSAAVLLVNLGTPQAPTPKAVRRYLAQFLSDPRVVEIPALLWQIVLRLVILPLRSRASAKKYASIWLAEGSPLRVYTEQQTGALRLWLEARASRVRVDYAMRYGAPSIPDALDQFKRAGIERVLVVPMYPQYAAASSATVFDQVFTALMRMRCQPELRIVRDYADHPAYIQALAEQVRQYWALHGRPNFAAGDKLILSFHGVPKRAVALGDPYYEQCEKTSALLTTALGLTSDICWMTFQSRFGRAQWLEPYTAATLKKLGAAGGGRVDVFCPGFTADCLETIEEIGLEVRDEFLRAGGKVFHRIACLNTAPAWVDALGQIVTQHLQGWPVQDGHLKGPVNDMTFIDGDELHDFD